MVAVNTLKNTGALAASGIAGRRLHTGALPGRNPRFNTAAEIGATTPGAVNVAAAEAGQTSVAPINLATAALFDRAEQAGQGADGIANKANIAVQVGMMAPLAVGAAKGIAGGTGWVAGKVGANAVQKGAKATQGAITRFTERSFGEVFGNNAFSKTVGKVSERVASSTGKAISWMTSKVGLGTAAGKAVESVPKAIGNSPSIEGAANAAFFGMSAVSTIHATSTLNRELKAASAVEAATGDKELAKSERRLAAGSYALSIAAEVGSMGMVVKQVAGKMPTSVWKSMLLFALPQLAEAGVRIFLPKSKAPAISMLTKAQASGQMVPPEAYACFLAGNGQGIQGACKAFAKRGPESAFTVAVAEQLAAERLTPAQILAEEKSGALEARVQRAIADNEAKKNVTPAAAAVEAAPTKSHVEALKNPKASAAALKPVVGEHTAKIAAAGEAIAAPQIS